MGQEAMAVVRIGEAAGKAKILLETDELIFRGEVRGKVAFKALTVIEPGADGLRLVWPEGEAEVELAESAAIRWADRIAHPPSLLDKLGIVEGTRVAVLDVDDEAFRGELAGRPVPVGE